MALVSLQGSYYDPENPWSRLFRSVILISVSHIFWPGIPWPNIDFCIQTFSISSRLPVSVEKEPKATRSGNARIHGMTHVAPASITYVATQVRTIIFWFSMNQFTNPSWCSKIRLTCPLTFTRSIPSDDSEWFYNSILELLKSRWAGRSEWFY